MTIRLAILAGIALAVALALAGLLTASGVNAWGAG